MTITDLDREANAYATKEHGEKLTSDIKYNRWISGREGYIAGARSREDQYDNLATKHLSLAIKYDAFADSYIATKARIAELEAALVEILNLPTYRLTDAEEIASQALQGSSPRRHMDDVRDVAKRAIKDALA